MCFNSKIFSRCIHSKVTLHMPYTWRRKINQLKKITWKAIKTKPSYKLFIKVNPNTLNLNWFEEKVGDTCKIGLTGVARTIVRTGKRGIPWIQWLGYIPSQHICPKGHPVELETPTDYRRWIEIIALRTNPREAYVLLSQENPNNALEQAQNENLVAKTNLRLEAAHANQQSSHPLQ